MVDMPAIFLESKYLPIILIIKSKILYFVYLILKLEKHTVNNSPMSSIYSVPNEIHQST